jgi:pimeloyl-ACP methyl ester carboxylesterase
MLPGLGADARLMQPQRAAFNNATTPDWIKPSPGESLPEYANRFAATIPINKDDILLGVSFGGMVALEIARQRPVRAIILIASCRHPRSIAPAVTRFASVGLRFPIPNAARRLAPLAIPVLGPMNPDHRKLLMDMAETTSMDFLRWGARAILGWAGVESVTCPTLHIHGRRDRVILCKAVRADAEVPGAGHVVNLTHAPEVNEAVRAFLDSLRTGS